MWEHYYQPTSLVDALELLHTHGQQARIVAGGTDVLVELSRRVRPTRTLIDITHIPELKYIRSDNGMLYLGALTSANDVIAAPDCVTMALPLAQACWELGAPQLRTRATIAGNLVTASPANDTIAALMALKAELVLLSTSGERIVPLNAFYPAFRKTVICPDELLREIRFPALRENQRGLFIKLGLRRSQAISVIDLAIVLSFESCEPNTGLLQVQEAHIALGCLAPTVVHAPTVEAFLRGKVLSADVCAEAGRLATQDAKPIDDVRGTAGYRLSVLEKLLGNGLLRLAAGREREGWPERVVLLETQEAGKQQHRGWSQTNSRGEPGSGETLDSSPDRQIQQIMTTINGQGYMLNPVTGKSLLDLLREDAGLTGTKEGCAEGECGACTVWLNGQAVMACLTPAPQAHGMQITTIEGLVNIQQDEQGLHPLQSAFIRNAAVQCGYCIPGFLMAGAKLLEEHAHPSLHEAQIGLSGNICRCTGYRKILDALLSDGLSG